MGTRGPRSPRRPREGPAALPELAKRDRFPFPEVAFPFSKNGPAAGKRRCTAPLPQRDVPAAGAAPASPRQGGNGNGRASGAPGRRKHPFAKTSCDWYHAATQGLRGETRQRQTVGLATSAPQTRAGGWTAQPQPLDPASCRELCFPCGTHLLRSQMDSTAGSSTKDNKGAQHGLVIKLPAFILLPLVKL
ncbi:hypothetical protein DV515_00015095, partial [Chloebia gouldiae]